MEKIIIKETESAASVILVQPVTDEVAHPLGETLNSLIEKGIKRIVLDMDGIHIIHTPVLGAIVFAHRKQHKAGGTLQLTHVSSVLRKLLETFALDRVIDIK